MLIISNQYQIIPLGLYPNYYLTLISKESYALKRDKKNLYR